MNSLELWQQILILVFYLGLYVIVKKLVITRFRKQ